MIGGFQMKKWIIGLSLVGLLVVAGLSYGGAKRITDYSGTIVVSNYADTSLDYGQKNSKKYKLSTAGTQSIEAGSYDHVYFGAYVPQMLDAQTADGALGELDSAIVHVYAQMGYKRITLGGDSIASLPGSLYVAFHGDLTPAADTSKAGVWRPGAISEGLAFDQIWFDLHCSDTSGDFDSIATTVTWWMRLVEDN